MHLVYIAAPFRGPTPWVVEQNVRRAEAWILPLADAGFVPVAPHCLYRYFDGELPDEFWLEATMEVMRSCAAVVRLPGASLGADAEVAEAQRLLIPVVCAPAPQPDPAIARLVVAVLRARLAEREAEEAV